MSELSCFIQPDANDTDVSPQFRPNRTARRTCLQPEVELGLQSPAALQTARPPTLEKHAAQSRQASTRNRPLQDCIAAAHDPDFLREYEVTMKGLDRMHGAGEKWFPREFPDLGKPADRVFFGGVRASYFPADLFRRPRYSGRRSLQGIQRPGYPACRRRLCLSAGLLPPAHSGRRLAGRHLRIAESRAKRRLNRLSRTLMSDSWSS